jgi:hypothetical protein
MLRIRNIEADNLSVLSVPVSFNEWSGKTEKYERLFDDVEI